MARSGAPVHDLTHRLSTITGLDRESLLRLDLPGLYQVLLELCAQLGERTRADVEATDLHENGTPRISSLVAVWLIGRITDALAPGQNLITLSAIPDADLLRSIGGVTALLMGAMHPTTRGEDHE